MPASNVRGVQGRVDMAYGNAKLLRIFARVPAILFEQLLGLWVSQHPGADGGMAQFTRLLGGTMQQGFKVFGSGAIPDEIDQHRRPKAFPHNTPGDQNFVMILDGHVVVSARRVPVVAVSEPLGISNEGNEIPWHAPLPQFIEQHCQTLVHSIKDRGSWLFPRQTKPAAG